MKKLVIAGICLGVAAVVCGGGFGVYKLMQKNADPVEVVTVSSLVDIWANETMPTSGMITSNASQNIYLSSDKLVDEVFVEEGDQVKVGDKLMAYDRTILELDLESIQLEEQMTKLKIEELEKTIASLKNGVVPENDSIYSGSSDYSPDDSDDDDDEGDDDASAGDGNLIKTAAIMTAVSEEGTQSLNQTSGGSATDSTPATEVETETETETETEESPLAEVKAFKKLKYNSKPYQGTGTKEDPYVFFCVDGVVIEASFMNKILGFNEAGTSKKKGGMRGDGTGSYAVLEIREGDAITGGFVKSVDLNGTVKADEAYAPDVTWTFTSEGVVKNVPDVDEPEDNGDDDDDIFGDGGSDDDGNSVEDIQDMIKSNEEELAELKLEQREQEIKVKQAERKLEEATVTATINGVVKSVGDPSLGQMGSEAFLTVTSDEGLYVKGNISELKLDKVKVGTTMTGMAYESGMTFEAKITSISEFPASSSEYFDWSERSNESQYPFLAYIEASDNLNNGEPVELSIKEDNGTGGESIYISKAYVRTEDGQSYVYLAGEDGRLVKHFVKTGATYDNATIEVLEGLNPSDRIAFPYGKKVKEGAKAVNEDGEEYDDSNDESDIEYEEGDVEDYGGGIEGYEGGLVGEEAE